MKTWVHLCVICNQWVPKFYHTVAGGICEACAQTPAGRDALETPDQRDRRLFGSAYPWEAPQRKPDADQLYPRSLRPEDV